MGFWDKLKASLTPPRPSPSSKTSSRRRRRPTCADSSATKPAPERIGDESFWSAWSVLFKTQERNAIELLTRFVQSYPGRLDLQARWPKSCANGSNSRVPRRCSSG